MATKLTVRLPDRVVEKLRARSEADGLSLNETVVRTLEHGLEHPSTQPEEEWWRALGDLVARPPLQPFDPESLHRLHQLWQQHPIGRERARGVMDALEWVRSDVLDEG
ncbi:MAG TPA: Arc family DNA-binding protein [Chloroflexota bacterium]|nr:Arc family DNA-binding protein [Chloroflexota bacterium]